LTEKHVRVFIMIWLKVEDFVEKVRLTSYTKNQTSNVLINYLHFGI